MLQQLKKEAGLACTENGAASLATSGSACLDLFASIGALRNAEAAEITGRFAAAFAENADLAMKLLFHARDVRGGLGERRVFRVILKWLAFHGAASLRKNVGRIAEYGRWDDLLILLGTPCEAAALESIRIQLEEDTRTLEGKGEISLLGKWLPSVNASSPDTVRQAKRLAHLLGMSDAQYRRLLTWLRRRIRILENHLRERDYSFDYSAQPSKALFRYRRAFFRNDYVRYQGFLDAAAAGKARLKASTLTPYDIVSAFFSRTPSEEERRTMDVTWKAQQDFTGEENALVVVDGSGSMYWSKNPCPAAVALSLGIYFAERNTGAFRNHFITFSRSPQLVEIKGDDIVDKLRFCKHFNEAANTNLEAVFELILNAAVRKGLPQQELPARLYIISDMEFDACVENASATNFENAKRRFAERGYRLPEIVFWNVASRNRQQPVELNERGVALVSGCSPRIFAMLKQGVLSPYAAMMEILESERYAGIAA